MKVNIYESDRFLMQLDVNDDLFAYQERNEEEMLYDVPDELVTEYIDIMYKFDILNKKLRNIYESK